MTADNSGQQIQSDAPRRFGRQRIVVFLVVLTIIANGALIFSRIFSTPEQSGLIGNSGVDIDEGIDGYDDFFPIDADSLSERLRSIARINDDIVTPTQVDRLIEALAKNIYAYKIGSAEAILESRLSADYSIRPDATIWHKEVLMKHLLEPGEEMPSDPDEIMRLLVSRQYGGVNGSGYANLYNQLSVQGSSIEFHRYEQLPQTLEDRFWGLFDGHRNTFLGGMITPNPSIEYHNSAERILAQSGLLIVVDIKLAASNSGKQKYSRFKRFYWSEDDDQWLAMEVVLLYAKERKADEFF